MHKIIKKIRKRWYLKFYNDNQIEQKVLNLSLI